MSGKNIFKLVLDYVYIVLLGCLQAFNYIIFIVINDFAPSGVNGIAVMIQYKLNFSVGFMSLIINIPLCTLAFFLVNKRFAIKTFIFCLVYSGVYLILQQLNLSRFQYNAGGVDTIYPVLIAGILSGFSYGCLYRINSCSGGTDIISRIISQRKPEINFFWLNFMLNAVVAVVSFFVYAQKTDSGMVYNFKPVCLCLLYSFTQSFIGNTILKGSRTAYQFTVITEHAEEIEQEIVSVLHHSSTRLEGYGTYSHQEKTVLVCVVNKHQLVSFKNILAKYPGTFSYVSTVNDTVGNFRNVKH